MSEFNEFSCMRITKEIFQQSKSKHYFRICIGRKIFDRHGYLADPIMEIAAFKHSKTAENYIQNIVKKHPSWDEDKLWCDKFMYTLPPSADDDRLLNDKIEYLRSL